MNDDALFLDSVLEKETAQKFIELVRQRFYEHVEACQHCLYHDLEDGTVVEQPCEQGLELEEALGKFKQRIGFFYPYETIETCCHDINHGWYAWIGDDPPR